MTTGETHQELEQEAILSGIKRFLETEAHNQKFLSEGSGGDYRLKNADTLEAAVSDFENHNYDKAISILERYHRVRRYRADEESDIEGDPATDNHIANELAGWIELLKSRRSST